LHVSSCGGGGVFLKSTTHVVPVENVPSASCRIDACGSFIRDDRSSVAMETIVKQFAPSRMNASLLRLMIFPLIGTACEIAIAFYTRAVNLILQTQAANFCGSSYWDWLGFSNEVGVPIFNERVGNFVSHIEKEKMYGSLKHVLRHLFERFLP
jgi:hypothetical protein